MTVFMGDEVINTCDSVKNQLRKMVEAIPSEHRIPTADILKAHFQPLRGKVIAPANPETRRSPASARRTSGILGADVAACEVEVDPETGETTIHQLVLVSDVGKALNPHQVEAQDEGAAVMGLGHTLMEQLVLGADGRILNLGSLDYRIPSIKDVPLDLEIFFIENADGPGPYGAKGAGERARLRSRQGWGGDESGSRRDAARIPLSLRLSESTKRKTNSEKRIEKSE